MGRIPFLQPSRHRIQTHHPSRKRPHSVAAVLDAMTEMSDPELIEACLGGNVCAWETLVGRYKRLVFSIPRKWNLSTEDAMEIFQAVWLDCFRELHSLRDL